MVLVASLYEFSRPSSPSGFLHGYNSQFYIEWEAAIEQAVVWYNVI